VLFLHNSTRSFQLAKGIFLEVATPSVASLLYSPAFGKLLKKNVNVRGKRTKSWLTQSVCVEYVQLKVKFLHFSSNAGTLYEQKKTERERASERDES